MIAADIITLIMLLAFPAARDASAITILIIDRKRVAFQAHLLPWRRPPATMKDTMPSILKIPPRNIPTGARKRSANPNTATPSPASNITMPLRIFRNASRVTPIGREEGDIDIFVEN